MIFVVILMGCHLDWSWVHFSLKGTLLFLFYLLELKLFFVLGHYTKKRELILQTTAVPDYTLLFRVYSSSWSNHGLVG